MMCDEKNMRTRKIASEGEYGAIKAEAAALARSGDYMRAYCHYTLCLADERFASRDDDLAFTLTNRALMSLKLGDYDAALKDGLGAIEMAKALPETAEGRRAKAVGKALYRIGCARVGLNEIDNAIETFLKALVIAPRDDAVYERLIECVRLMGMTYVCDAYADAISEGEMPNVLSPRDGKWLKPVRPESKRVSRNAMAQTLLDCAIGHEAEWRREYVYTFLTASVKDTKALSNMRRGFLSGIRASVYAHMGNHEQAVTDYRVALAYYPDWARAYFGYAQSIERELVLNNVTRVEIAQGSTSKGYRDNLVVDALVAAALWTKRALELDASNGTYENEFNRLADKLSSQIRDVLLKGTREALAWLEVDKWENAPEYIRPRPKYYYFYEMMKERIYEHFPELPQPVMDKLLSLDAGELDLLLQYPRAIKGQTEEFLDVYKHQGGEYLLTYKTPQMSWEEVKALKGRGTQGLLPGASGAVPFASTEDEHKDPGSGHALEKNTDHALIGASGADGLTRAEFLGAPVVPRLPPDALRDANNLLVSVARDDALLPPIAQNVVRDRFLSSPDDERAPVVDKA